MLLQIFMICKYVLMNDRNKKKECNRVDKIIKV